MALGQKLAAATRRRRPPRSSPRANAGLPGDFVPGVGQRDWVAGSQRGVQYDSSTNPLKAYGPRPTRAPYSKRQQAYIERHLPRPTRRTPGSRSRRGRPTLN
jgi:hypothetical protein